jgi:CDP-diacylglycerol--glycerol-3-phosphate 3-phosphatidyltransferase
MSLVRIPLGLALLPLLAADSGAATLAATVIVIVAGVSDGLDGYLARRMNAVSAFGIALDPICDKVFAAILVVGVLLYRDFPLWLALVIVGRDLAILIGGLALMRRRRVSLPSNMTGKYAFAAIAVLLASYVVRYPWGIWTSAMISLALLAASTAGYARVFYLVSNGRAVPTFVDSTLKRTVRHVLIYAYAAVYLYLLYVDVIAAP